MDRRHKVLCIDDDQALRKMMENFLQEDFKVITLGDGKEALDWIQLGNIPDLIVCDVNMEPMDGEEFVKNIQSGELFKYIPVIMLSGDEESKTRIKFYKLGVKNFLTKPFNPEELVVLAKLLTHN